MLFCSSCPCLKRLGCSQMECISSQLLFSLIFISSRAPNRTQPLPTWAPSKGPHLGEEAVKPLVFLNFPTWFFFQRCMLSCPEFPDGNRVQCLPAVSKFSGVSFPHQRFAVFYSVSSEQWTQLLIKQQKILNPSLQHVGSRKYRRIAMCLVWSLSQDSKPRLQTSHRLQKLSPFPLKKKESGSFNCCRSELKEPSCRMQSELSVFRRLLSRSVLHALQGSCSTVQS